MLCAIRDIDRGRGVDVVTIADATKLSKSTVHRALKPLYAAHLVTDKGPRNSLTPAGLMLSSESRVA